MFTFTTTHLYPKQGAIYSILKKVLIASKERNQIQHMCDLA